MKFVEGKNPSWIKITISINSAQYRLDVFFLHVSEDPCGEDIMILKM